MGIRVMLGSKIGKLEYKIDKANADFDNVLVMSSINQNGGTLDKQAFWKLKKGSGTKRAFQYLIKALVMRSLTDQENIRNEYKNEFTHRK